MSIAWLCLISAVAFVGLSGLLISGRLRFEEDFFFLVLVGEILVYLHIAPLAWYSRIPAALRSIYVSLSVECLLLFELPLLLTYLLVCHRNRRAPGRQPPQRVQTVPKRGSLLGGLAAGFALAFVLVVLRYHLLYLRLGAAEETNRLIGLPYPAYALFRFFGVTAVGMILILIVAASLSLPGPGRRRITGLATVVTLAYLFQRALNSRLDVVMLFTLIFGAIATTNPGFRLPKKFLVWGLAVVLLAVYGMRVAINARAYYADHGEVSWSVLNPFPQAEVQGSASAGDLGFRLNGIDLMAQITPAARAEGFAWGRAWAIPARVVGNQILFRRAANLAYLHSYLATSKRYLILAYTTIDTPDYPSCMLADAYGNFGPSGMILVGIVMGSALGACVRVLRRRHSRYGLVIALFMLQNLVVFEWDFWSLLTSWIRIVPALLVFLALTPFGPPAEEEACESTRMQGSDWAAGRRGSALHWDNGQVGGQHAGGREVREC